LPRRRSSNAAITVKDQVYLVGGWDSTPKHPGDIDGTFLSAIDVFDLVTEQVRTAAFEMPKPLRRAFSGVNYNNQLVLVGGLGEGGSHFELISQVTSIDPESGNVFEYPALPFATFAPAAGVLNNELFVFGGMFKLSDMEYDYVAHIYALDFTSKQWRHTGRYVQQTKGFSQVFNLDDKSLGILGGHHYFEGYDAPLTNFETFTPATTKF
jgi:N-acetylneuraminic acid mutarotase